jgi:hypothetical protein
MPGRLGSMRRMIRFGKMENTKIQTPMTKAIELPDDFEVAHVNFGAMCGHGALAAALGMRVCHVMQYFPAGQSWVSIPDMEAALRKAGKLPGRLAGWAGNRVAVSIIQFTGPWMEPGVPPAARCRYRHWVATRDGLVWDVNDQRWQAVSEWERIIPELMPKRGVGWEVFRSLVW